MEQKEKARGTGFGLRKKLKTGKEGTFNPAPPLATHQHHRSPLIATTARKLHGAAPILHLYRLRGRHDSQGKSWLQPSKLRKNGRKPNMPPKGLTVPLLNLHNEATSRSVGQTSGQKQEGKAATGVAIATTGTHHRRPWIFIVRAL